MAVFIIAQSNESLIILHQEKFPPISSNWEKIPSAKIKSGKTSQQIFKPILQHEFITFTKEVILLGVCVMFAITPKLMNRSF